MKQRRRLLLLLLFTVFSLGVLGQSFTLQGKVSDDENNPLELVSVTCSSQGKVTFTNIHGEFSLELNSEDSVVVKFSMIGYISKTRVLRNPKGKQTLILQLNSQNERT